ncbi:MAG: flagellar FlbD family protein [Kineosporiaceae bacterium]
MIPLTRLNGRVFGLNPDAVVRADVTPDTVLTLADGSKYVVSESLAEVIDLVVEFRAEVQRRALDPAAGGFAATATADDPDDGENGENGVDGPDDPDVIRLRPRRG